MKENSEFELGSNTMVPKGIPGLISDHQTIMSKYLGTGDEFLMANSRNTEDLEKTETGRKLKNKQVNQLRHTPRWISHDRLVLKFFCYFEETINFKAVPQLRRRFIELYFYTKDNTIEINEPKQRNSGIMQGMFLKKTPISQLGITVTDFVIGSSFKALGHVFHLFDCDLNTRNYFKNTLKMQQVECVMKPDPMDQSFKVRPPGRVGLTLSQENHLENKRFNGNFYGDFQKYLKYGKQTLKFLASWLDTHALDETRYFTILYFLCDDTIEIKEKHIPNSGRDENSRFLNRNKPDKGDTSIHWKDFKTGSFVKLYERDFFIISCDEPTIEFYSSKNIAQETQQEVMCYKKAMTRLIPNSGRRMNSDEKASQQKRAFRKLKEFGDQALKLRLKMRNCSEENSKREFVLAYYLADEQLAIFEPQRKNSGFMGGKFLEKNKYLNVKTGKMFTEKDFKATLLREVPEITIQKRDFEVIFVDKFSRSYLGVAFENKGRANVSELQRIAQQLREFIERTQIDFRRTFYSRDSRQHKFLKAGDIDSCMNSLQSKGLMLLNTQVEVIKKKYSCHGRFYYIDFCSDMTDLINASAADSNTMKSTNVSDIENMLNKKLQNEGQSLRILFRKFDTDKSGTLTFSEFQELLKHFNIFLSLQQVSEIMARYDIDKEGTIEYQEFCSRIERTQNKANRLSAQHGIQSLSLSDFTALQGDKRETKADYLSTVQTQENKFNEEAYNSKILTRFVFLCSSKRTELRQIFRQIDDSKDGRLSKDEFRKAIQMFREFSLDDQLTIINYFYNDQQEHLLYEEFMETVATLSA